MSFRLASSDDAVALRDLEQAANVVALAHVFTPALHPFPAAAVLVRWRRVLEDPACRVEVLDGAAALRCLVAHDDTVVRHLAVHPDEWGHGLAGRALARSVAAIRAGGRVPRLWCLAANARALGMYEHLGWRRTGAERAAEWPPYPVELGLSLEGSGP